MMSSNANKIYMAIVAHTAWKKRLNNVIDTGKNTYNTDHHACEFGTWLDENEEELQQFEHYTKVKQLHKKFHFEAANIIDLATSGRGEEAKKALDYGSDFETISHQLVEEIIAWHDVVIGKK